jgi:hypothetical protein|tara:strand:+ start:397 stop:1122 length:726 start_codon:yes stop_codon:yes gene_type:complete
MDIIAMLKDDNEYYNGIGKDYLSNSNIGQLLKHPALFQKSEPDNKNFMVGRYFHQLILEPEKALEFPIVDASSRNTKIYKDTCADGNARLLQREADEVLEWVQVIYKNKDFKSLINQASNHYEVPAIGKLFGAMWKGKADIVTDDYVIDLKTTSDLQKFTGYSSRAYNYDSQAYIYQALFGKPMVFLVIDKTTKLTGLYGVSEEALANGEDKVKRAVDVFNTFYGDKPTQKIEDYYDTGDI